MHDEKLTLPSSSFLNSRFQEPIVAISTSESSGTEHSGRSRADPIDSVNGFMTDTMTILKVGFTEANNE